MDPSTWEDLPPKVPSSGYWLEREPSGYKSLDELKSKLNDLNVWVNPEVLWEVNLYQRAIFTKGWSRAIDQMSCDWFMFIEEENLGIWIITKN